MRLLHDIAERTDFLIEESVEVALKDMHQVPDVEIQLWVVIGETLNATSHETREKVALARTEKERRDNERSEYLTKKTTVISTGVGAIATIVGAVLGVVATLAVSGAGGSPSISAAGDLRDNSTISTPVKD